MKTKNKKSVKAVPSFFGWHVLVQRGDESDTCKYSASYGKPVTANHVRTSPAVKKFIGEDHLVSITPADEFI